MGAEERNKTLVLRVRMDPATEQVVRSYAEASARWEQKVFGRWYADFRAHRHDLSGCLYRGLVSEKRISAKALGRKGGRVKYHLNVQGPVPNLYSAFLTRSSRVEPAVPTSLKNSALHATLSHLGTTMEGFLDRDLRRRRAHERRVLRRQREARARRYGHAPSPWHPPNFYPRFTPIARIGHGQVEWHDLALGFSFPHPFLGHDEVLKVDLMVPKDRRYHERLSTLRTYLLPHEKVKGHERGCKNGHGFAVELHYHDQGDRREGWYAHVTVFSPVAEEHAEVECVAGVHIGERNPATLLALRGSDGVADRVARPVNYEGLNTRHALERQVARVARLRSLQDRGEKDVRAALKRAKGRTRRTLHTLAHQVSHDVVKRAKEVGADALVFADLSKLPPPARTRDKQGFPTLRPRRKYRRLLSRWNRGEIQKAIGYKARAAGLRLPGVNGSGLIVGLYRCPQCGEPSRDAWNPRLEDFTCPKCAFREAQDVAKAASLAARGWNYFHSDKRQPGGASSPPPGTFPVPSSPPSEPDCVSTGVDTGPQGPAGASSTPSSTVGGAVGSTSQTLENGEHGTGGAVTAQAANRPEANNAGRGTSKRHGSRKPKRQSKRPGGEHGDGGEGYMGRTRASAEVVTPSRGTARTDGSCQILGVRKGSPRLGSVGCSKTGSPPRQSRQPAVATAGWNPRRWRLISSIRFFFPRPMSQRPDGTHDVGGLWFRAVPPLFDIRRNGRMEPTTLEG